MRNHVRRLTICATLIVSIKLQAQQPSIIHAHVSTQAANASLVSQIQAIAETTTTASWVGYVIPVESGFHYGSDSTGAVMLEGNPRLSDHGAYLNRTYDHVNLLLRLQDGSVSDARIEAPDRQLDAGGLSFTWLDGVTPEISIRLLQSIAISPGPEKLHDAAIFLVSIHQSPETVPALATLASAGHNPELREKAAFWLAPKRSPEAFDTLKQLVRGDIDSSFREKLAFDLTLSHDPAAPEELIRMAHSDASPQVRRQAQFWMATLGGKKIANNLRASAQSDPEIEIRESAVFALSRLPGDEAATQLIQVAETSKDPAVRKQAVFWLGQSNDARALDYLTRLLEQE